MKDLTPDGDAALLARAQAGDVEAFGEIVRIHQAGALRLATIITGDQTEAFDIVQDAFVRAHRALSNVGGSETLRPWLMRIVANQAKNSQRTSWRRQARHLRHAALRANSPVLVDDAVIDADEAARLSAAVATLAARDREIIGCRYFAGLSERETAEVLGVATGTVKSRTARALDRLRATMAMSPAGPIGGAHD